MVLAPALLEYPIATPAYGSPNFWFYFCFSASVFGFWFGVPKHTIGSRESDSVEAACSSGDGVQQQVVSGEQQQQHSEDIASETGLLEQIDVVELSRLPTYAAKKAYFERRGTS
jgi:hypothetical protein